MIYKINMKKINLTLWFSQKSFAKHRQDKIDIAFFSNKSNEKSYIKLLNCIWIQFKKKSFDAKSEKNGTARENIEK